MGCAGRAGRRPVREDDEPVGHREAVTQHPGDIAPTHGDVRSEPLGQRTHEFVVLKTTKPAGNLLGGSVVIESVFAWPGLGLLAFQALFARDFNLLMGIFLFSSCLVVVVNLVIDLTYTALDPRVVLR